MTRATLPPIEEYVEYLRGIWDSHWLTNNGPLVRELEERLRAFLEVSDLWFANNCTSALQVAIKALELRGEVITTPFSYVATTGVVIWESCTPVFVDVRPDDLTIDPQLIEAAITPRTTAILATHVYGFPCAIPEIERIAKKHGLKVIYDAAHAFGCRLNGRSLASFGDISCLSFHATKVFHTIEGGAIVINGSPEHSTKVRLMRAFGHFGDEHTCIGINAKNSEFHAAMGLCNLPRFSSTVGARKAQHEFYSQLLSGKTVRIPGTSVQGFEYNFAYFPVLLPSEAVLLRCVQRLALLKIHPRRYFYPALNRLPYVAKSRNPIAEDAANTVLCLPMSDQVEPALQERIASILLEESAAG